MGDRGSRRRGRLTSSAEPAASDTVHSRALPNKVLQLTGPRLDLLSVAASEASALGSLSEGSRRAAQLSA